MLHIKLSNMQNLNMALNHGFLLDWQFCKNLCKSFCKEKDPKTKGYFEKQFKSYRNRISSLLREIKDFYYKQYFEDNKKNLRLIWQTIKGMINMNKKSDESISSLLIDHRIIISAKEIFNHLKNFFTNVAEKINKNIVKSKKTNKQTKKKTIILSRPRKQ